MGFFHPRPICILRGICLAMVLLAGLLAAEVPCARAQQPEIKDLAARLAASLKKKLGSSHSTIRVAVFNFPNADGGESQLGVVWARELAEALAAQGSPFALVPEAVLEQLVRQAGFRGAQLRDPDYMRQVARRAGAQTALVGVIQPKGKTLRLEVTALRTDEWGQFADEAVKIPLTKEISALYFKFTPPTSAETPPESQDAAAPSLTVDSSATGTPPRGFDTAPRCVWCPGPEYTREAGDARYSGVAVLRVNVDADGRVLSVQPVRSLPYGLTERAIEAVRGWKFQPALLAGKPVACEITVEVSFRFAR